MDGDIRIPNFVWPKIILLNLLVIGKSYKYLSLHLYLNIFIFDWYNLKDFNINDKCFIVILLIFWLNILYYEKNE